jgi:hypothetical protein
MAIRIQLRRDTAANWVSANPVLLAGEIGIETDTLKFKIGNGNNWNSITDYANTTPAGLSSSLEDYILLTDRGAANGVASLNSSTKVPNNQIDDTYYATVSSVTSAVNTLDTSLSGDIETINTTLGGVATDISDINSELGTINSTISGHTTDISDLDTAKAPKASPTFTGDVVLPSTTTIGDISSTELSYVNGVTSGIQAQIDAKVSTTSFNDHTGDTTGVHGIADTSALATKTYADDAVSTHNLDTTSVHGIDDTAELATKTYANNAVSTHNSDTTSVHGIADTSVLLTTAGGTVDSLTITRNLTVNGTTTTVDTANLEVTDSLIYLASEQFDTDSLDIGIFGAYGDVQTGHFHTGVVRDASDGKWKLVSNAPEPVDNAIDFSGVTYDTLKVGGVEFSDGTQTKEGVPSRTPIISKTSSYTLSSLSERDSMIEVSSSSGTTITIPTNSAVAFPVGASIDICQTSTGQVTIAGDTGVTVNATPGLKLRTQWSTCTLFKRDTNTWLVYGDLTA